MASQYVGSFSLSQLPLRNACHVLILFLFFFFLFSFCSTQLCQGFLALFGGLSSFASIHRCSMRIILHDHVDFFFFLCVCGRRWVWCLTPPPSWSFLQTSYLKFSCLADWFLSIALIPICHIIKHWIIRILISLESHSAYNVLKQEKHFLFYLIINNLLFIPLGRTGLAFSTTILCSQKLF